MKFKFAHMDAGENVFFSRQLEALRAQAFDVQHAELKGMQLVPVKSDFNIGAVEYTYRVFDQVGKAIITSDGSDKGPRADIKGFETTVRFYLAKASYGYNMEEVRNAMMAGLDLQNRKAIAARKAIAILTDNAILLGSTHPDLAGTGLTGLFTASGTEVYTVPTGDAGSTLWSTKTPDEIVRDLHGMVFQVEQNSNEVEKCNTLVLPLAVKGLVMSTRMGDGSNQTIMQHFLESNGSIKTVEFSQKLNSSSAWTGRRAVAYNKSPDKLEAPIVTEFEQLPPQYDGFEAVTHCQAKIGGTVIYFPKSVVYADNI